MTHARDAIRALFGADQDQTANQPPLPAIFPDQLAPGVMMPQLMRRLNQ